MLRDHRKYSPRRPRRGGRPDTPISRRAWLRFVTAIALALAAQMAALLLPGLATAAAAVTVPSGFVDATFVELPPDATSMQFAPDGRLFVCRQGGELRVVLPDGRLLAQPFVKLNVNAIGERGLLGVAFDPDFERNGFVYVHYTTSAPVLRNRVSRFTAQGNVAVPGSERVLLNLDPLGQARIHNGGALHFGNDGKLYLAVGDNGAADNAQSLLNRFGKILRINRDGTIPPGNPFYTRASGANRAIWALGLRNPFTMAFERSTGRLFVNDVGKDSFEEINTGGAGANFGWPLAEGPSGNPAFTDPIHYYAHAGSNVCAITGGAFYEPDVLAFPAAYRGQYFFADHCGGWIRRLNPQTGAVQGFAAGTSGAVDLDVGPDGALYYLERRAGRVGRISHSTGQPPVVTLQPASRTVGVGQSVTFRVGANGSAPLAFQWRRNGQPVQGATAASYTHRNVQLADDGALFDVVVSNAFGRAVSEAARLTVIAGAVPTAAITRPSRGSTYAAAQAVQFVGTASDAEDGTLPASAFTWRVDFHHADHVHPHVPPRSGVRSGWFWIPAVGETAANVFYRIHLRVRDSDGLTRWVTRDLRPRTSTITLATNPAGLQLRLDGQPVTTPHTFVGVVGVERRLEAVSPQFTGGGQGWRFVSWSDGGGRVHAVRTPGVDTTYTATFAPR